MELCPGPLNKKSIYHKNLNSGKYKEREKLKRSKSMLLKDKIFLTLISYIHILNNRIYILIGKSVFLLSTVTLLLCSLSGDNKNRKKRGMSGETEEKSTKRFHKSLLRSKAKHYPCSIVK